MSGEGKQEACLKQRRQISVKGCKIVALCFCYITSKNATHQIKGQYFVSDIKAIVYVQSARTCLMAQLRTDLFNESILFMQVQTVEGGNRQTDS